MAKEESSKKSAAKKRVVKKPVETVREKAAKKATETPKKRRLNKATTTAKKPISAAKRIGAKEYHPVKRPDNKLGRFLTKSRRLTPAFLRNSWAELKQVEWPTRKETAKLTLAVLLFALIIGGLVAIIDFGLDKVFKELLLS